MTELEQSSRWKPTGNRALINLLVASLTLAISFSSLWRALGAFCPGSNNVPFTSDSAIPVLMANQDRPLTVFNLYYYGTDRWGGWPFLLPQMLHRFSGYHWSDQGLFTIQTIWVFIGAIVIALLNRRYFALIALFYLLVVCLDRVVYSHLFELSQVYAWQLTALLLSWYSIRGLFNGYVDSANHAPVQFLVIHALMAFLFSFLAIWSSIASLIFLFFLLGLEMFRAYLKREKEPRDKRHLRISLFVFAVVSVAALAEMLQKMSYHRYSLEHYGSEFRTHFELDTGHLSENLQIQLRHLGQLLSWPFYVLPSIALLALAFGFLYGVFKKKDLEMRKSKALLSDDATFLIFGTLGIAAINFVLVVTVSHVRVNFYDVRYLTLTILFGGFAALLSIILLVQVAVGYRSFSRYAKPAIVMAGVMLLAFRFPAQSQSTEYQTLKKTALAVGQKAPCAVLIGGYWETYVFAALQPINAMIPIPLEGQEVRMPWTRSMPGKADRVIVEYRHSNLEARGLPPQYLNQYGCSLMLDDPDWYVNEQYAFALYVRDTRTTADLRGAQSSEPDEVILH